MSKRGKGRGRGRSRDMNLDKDTVEKNDFPPLARPGENAGNGNDRGWRKDKKVVNPGEKNIGHEQRNIAPTTILGMSDELDKMSIAGQSDKTKSMSDKRDPGFAGNTSSRDDSQSSLVNSKFPSRPGLGSAGREIGLISNYFGLKSKVKNIYHYDIEVTSLDQVKKYGKPVKKKTAAEAAKANISHIEHQLDRNIGKARCQEIFERLIICKNLKSFNPVYDGNKNIFTSVPLPQEFDSLQNFTVELEDSGKTRKYEVVMQPVKKKNGTNCISLNDFMQKKYDGRNEIIMALNSILNHRNPPSSQIQIGRSFFFLNQHNKISLGEGLEIWFGYNQSVHLTQVGPAVVINLAAKAFHKAGPVIDYINDVLRRDITQGPPLKPFEIQKIEDAMKRVRVNVTHLKYPRKYYIDGISKRSAQDLKMNFDGKEITIAEYFQSKYGRLKFAFLPCLFMRTPQNQTYIPFEHCKVIEGQPKLGKLSPFLGAKMIKQTAIAPNDRFQCIEKSAQDVQRLSGEKMRTYHLFMELQPLQVTGRVIAPPSLAYFDRGLSNPDERGVWRMEGKNFFKASVDIDSWILLCFARSSDQELQRFADTLTKNGSKLGLNLNKFLGIKKFGPRDTAERVLKDAAERVNATFAIIVLCRNDYSHNYDEIKFIADYKLGFVTQCIEDKVLGRFNDQIANNLCLKINTKLGGINHILLNKPRVFSKPFIVFGADAVHSPRGMGCPSIAAVVGSMDAYPSKYKVACRVQENEKVNKVSQELILEIEDMVKSILKAFYHHTKGKYPEKIIFFRDGVSEGQFKKVRDYEVSAIQKASQDIIGIIVPITFIIVQKRHQTRFRPRNPREGIGRGGNIPPGTTVDTDVTDPEHFDYFLNSHEGIQGTSKPAHYTVLHDDNKFDSDELQKLSYHLCYTYSKCNRSISIPAPVMYADLACYRAKKYADFHIQKEKESLSASSDSSSKLPDHVKHAINSMGDYKTSMFFV